jgi:hypothetical protein
VTVVEHLYPSPARRPVRAQTAVDLVQRDETDTLAMVVDAQQTDHENSPGPHSVARQLERMTAVANQAITSLMTALQASIVDAQNANAMSQWRSMGHAFLRWAHDNPMQFQVMSTPSLLDIEQSGLAEGYRHIRAELRRLISAAAADGDIYCISVEDTLVSVRSFIYGLARMHVDGHFPGWGVRNDDALSTMQRLFDSYLFRLRRTL